MRLLTLKKKEDKKLKYKLFIFLFVLITSILFLSAFKIMAQTSTSTNEQISIHNAHAYPNPFDNEKKIAKIKFKIYVKKAISDVSIAVIVYDFNGKKTWTKRKNVDKLYPGYNTEEVLWGGDNDMGEKVANGIYYAKIIVEGSNTKVKVIKILVK